MNEVCQGMPTSGCAELGKRDPANSHRGQWLAVTVVAATFCSLVESEKNVAAEIEVEIILFFQSRCLSPLRNALG